MNTVGTAAVKPALQSLRERLNDIPRPLLLAGAALTIALLVAATLWSREPDYRVLFSDLNERDGGDIMAALAQANVPYKFADGSATLMVPANRVHELRLQLAAQGLPRGGAVGFELLDDSRFGVSQFTEQVNYQRALEGELARTIENMHAVRSARVHLAMPRQSLFVRDKQSPSASILLHLYPGRALDTSQITSIAHLVSSSVSQLTVANISIVDQHGRLLSQPDANGHGLDDRQLRQIRDVERTYAQRIEAILTPLVGPGNARAQVNAELDFSRREETRETYTPNDPSGQAAIRSRQTSDTDQIGTGQAQGVPGALTNQPPLEPVAPIVNPPQAAPADNEPAAQTTALPTGSNLRREATTNYEIDRNIVHLQHPTGAITRLSVAVIVNYRPDAQGEPQPLQQDELDKLTELVKQAMGFSVTRGDSLSLMNGQFVTEAIVDDPWWKQAAYIKLALTALAWLVGLMVLLWLWLSVGRPLLQRYIQPAAPATAPGAPVENDADEEQAKRDAEARARKQSRYEENLQTARELAEKDPLAVASVLRNWIEKHD